MPPRHSQLAPAVTDGDVATALPAFKRLCSKLWMTGDPDDGGALQALSRDVAAINDFGEALSDEELAEDLGTLARLVADGTVSQDEADAFLVVANDVRAAHAHVTPILVRDIKAHGLDTVDKFVHSSGDEMSGKVLRAVFFDVTMEHDFRSLGSPRAAALVAVPRRVRHVPQARSPRSRSRRRRSGGSPGRPAGDDDPEPEPDLGRPSGAAA